MKVETLIDQALLRWHKPSARCALDGYFEALANEWRERRAFYAEVARASGDDRLVHAWALIEQALDARTEADHLQAQAAFNAYTEALAPDFLKPFFEPFDYPVLTEKDWLAIEALLGDEFYEG